MGGRRWEGGRESERVREGWSKRGERGKVGHRLKKRNERRDKLINQ